MELVSIETDEWNLNMTRDSLARDKEEKEEITKHRITKNDNDNELYRTYCSTNSDDDDI